MLFNHKTTVAMSTVSVSVEPAPLVDLSVEQIRFPRTLMTSSREELDIELTVDGNFPKDLTGHLFLLTPCGTVEEGATSQPNNVMLGGDGMIYRLDFENGTVKLTSRLVKTPSFYADVATHFKSEYASLRFNDAGIGRLSLPLGIRDTANTAFTVMKFPNDKMYRMGIAADNGRPYEIDVLSLEVVTAIGSLDEWRELLGNGIRLFGRSFFSQPFPLVMTPAHPQFDSVKGKFITVNYGRALSYALRAILTTAQDANNIWEAASLLLRNLPKLLFYAVVDVPFLIFRWLRTLFGSNETVDYTYLMEWDGETEFERWKLVLPNGKPVVIIQTLHQLAVTEDYIVLLDAAFKFTADQLFNEIPFLRTDWVERLVRGFLTGAQQNETTLYLVKRSDMKHGQKMTLGSEGTADAPAIVAQKIVLPPEAIHLLANYKNPNDEITIHLTHNCAADFAEWVREYDTTVLPPNEPTPPELRGMVAVGQMDVGRYGRYVIDGSTGSVKSLATVSSIDVPHTLNIGLYTYRDTLPDGTPMPTIDNIFWTAGGYYKELMTTFIYDTYKNYEYRTVPLDVIHKLLSEGRPCNLCRLDTKTMQIADYYQFENPYMALSPQFVPRVPATTVELSTDGYIVCFVASDKDGQQIWVFDAANLKQGVICKFAHEKLFYGFSLHTAWLPRIQPREASYFISPEEDFAPRVTATNNPLIEKLFREEVYPKFKP